MPRDVLAMKFGVCISCRPRRRSDPRRGPLRASDLGTVKESISEGDWPVLSVSRPPLNWLSLRPQIQAVVAGWGFEVCASRCFLDARKDPCSTPGASGRCRSVANSVSTTSKAVRDQNPELFFTLLVRFLLFGCELYGPSGCVAH